MLLTILMYFSCLILCMLRCTLLGLSVYCDAKSKHVMDATKWGVIAGLFGILGWIVYLIRARKRTLPAGRCPVCGAPLMANEQTCRKCLAVAGASAAAGRLDSGRLAHRSKTLLISWLIATAMMALVTPFFLIGLFSARGSDIQYSTKSEETVGLEERTDFSMEQSGPWFDETP